MVGCRLAVVVGVRFGVGRGCGVGRLSRLLHEDGILVPLLTLRGLNRDGGVLPDAVRAVVDDIARNHLVWGVRVEASRLFDAVT